MMFEPSSPGLTNCRGEDEVVPKVEEHVNVYEVTDVLRSAFSHYLFVDTGSIRSIRQVIGERGTAPSNVEWQLYLAGRLRESCFCNIIGNDHRPRRGTEGQTSSARHAWILRLRHCPVVSRSGFSSSERAVEGFSQVSDVHGRGLLTPIPCPVVGTPARPIVRMTGWPRSGDRLCHGDRAEGASVTGFWPMGAISRSLVLARHGDYLRTMSGAAILGKRFLLCPPAPTSRPWSKSLTRHTNRVRGGRAAHW